MRKITETLPSQLHRDLESENQTFLFVEMLGFFWVFNPEVQKFL